MYEFTDQLKRKIILKNFPSQRIISLVPSQTELLFYFGLNKEVIGITKFCVHPEEWFQTKAKAGGTKNIDINRIKRLQPDLIIANKEENDRKQIEELATYFPVYVSDVNTLQNALDMTEDVGIMTGKSAETKILSKKIKELFLQIPVLNQPFSTLYLIWKNPYMTVGGDTFISEMLRYCGFQNIFENEKRYPEISDIQLLSTNCQLILLSSEPFPFREKHIEEIQKVLPSAKIYLVDGEMFSWYGSRLIKAAEYFKDLINKINLTV